MNAKSVTLKSASHFSVSTMGSWFGRIMRQVNRHHKATVLQAIDFTRLFLLNVAPAGANSLAGLKQARQLFGHEFRRLVEHDCSGEAAVGVIKVDGGRMVPEHHPVFALHPRGIGAEITLDFHQRLGRTGQAGGLGIEQRQIGRQLFRRVTLGIDSCLLYTSDAADDW